MKLFGKKEDKTDPVQEQLKILEGAISTTRDMYMELEDKVNKSSGPHQHNEIPQNLTDILQAHHSAIENLILRIHNLEESQPRGELPEHLTEAEAWRLLAAFITDINNKIDKKNEKGKKAEGKASAP